jgi:hypothetical protein
MESTGSPVPPEKSKMVRARLRTLKVVPALEVAAHLQRVLPVFQVRFEETSMVASGSVVMG